MALSPFFPRIAVSPTVLESHDHRTPISVIFWSQFFDEDCLVYEFLVSSTPKFTILN